MCWWFAILVPIFASGLHLHLVYERSSFASEVVRAIAEYPEAHFSLKGNHTISTTTITNGSLITEPGLTTNSEGTQSNGSAQPLDVAKLVAHAEPSFSSHTCLIVIADNAPKTLTVSEHTALWSSVQGRGLMMLVITTPAVRGVWRRLMSDLGYNSAIGVASSDGINGLTIQNLLELSKREYVENSRMMVPAPLENIHIKLKESDQRLQLDFAIDPLVRPERLAYVRLVADRLIAAGFDEPRIAFGLISIGESCKRVIEPSSSQDFEDAILGGKYSPSEQHPLIASSTLLAEVKSMHELEPLTLKTAKSDGLPGSLLDCLSDIAFTPERLKKRNTRALLVINDAGPGSLTNREHLRGLLQRQKIAFLLLQGLTTADNRYAGSVIASQTMLSLGESQENVRLIPSNSRTIGMDVYALLSKVVEDGDRPDEESSTWSSPTFIGASVGVAALFTGAAVIYAKRRLAQKKESDSTSVISSEMLSPGRVQIIASEIDLRDFESLDVLQPPSDRIGQMK